MKILATLALCALPTFALAQTSFEADPQHFQLIFENDCVLVERAKLGAGESTTAPYVSTGGVVVNLTDAAFERVTQDGKKGAGQRKAKDAWWVTPARIQTITNTSAQPIEWVVIRPKGKAGCEK